MERLRPGFSRMFEVDYPTFAGISFPIVFWFVYLLIVLSGRGSPMLMMVETAATAVGLGVVAWRYWLIRQTFKNGTEVKGVLKKISFWKYFLPSHGTVHMGFNHQGKDIIVSGSIHKAKRTREMKEGQKITIIYDPRRPYRAFIKDLYL